MSDEQRAMSEVRLGIRLRLIAHCSLLIASFASYLTEVAP